MKFKQLITTWMFLSVSVSAQAESTGFTSVLEIKSTGSVQDVYLTVDHQCEGLNSRRYHLQDGSNQQLTQALSAHANGSSVLITYECSQDGYPVVTSIQ